jgi:hypothetical protein
MDSEESKMSEEYFKVNTKIIDNFGNKFPAPTLMVYIGLLRFADSRGIISENRTQKQWADAIGVGKTTLARSIHILQEEGLLKIIKPRNPTDCCGYIVIDPGEAVSSSRKRRLFINYKQGKRSDI